jgi:hypothetical protein
MNVIESLLKEYRGEVNVATTSFYAWKSINSLAAADSELFQALQRNALSWNIVTHALQITFFTALGRLFDGDKRSLSVSTFIRRCRSSLDDFSKSSFEARRTSDNNGVRPGYMDEFLSSLYVPVSEDFEALAEAVVPWEKLYKAKYQPIRHKLIAHKDLATIGSTNSLFANTNIDEAERILEFLHQTAAFIEQLFHNGRLTKLSDHRLSEEDYIRQDLESLLRKISTLPMSG